MGAEAEAVLSNPVAQRYHWVTNGEPHTLRRREILSKYGDQIRKLYGYDHATAWQVMFVVVLQVLAAYTVRDWNWLPLCVAIYLVSATANQNLFCAQHEISHFLAFRKPAYNKVLALVANCPLVVPVCVKFREYHHDHHLHLGVDGGDVDLPTNFESSLVTGFVAKFVWGLVYLVIYGVRPLLVRPKAANLQDAVNWAVVLAFDAGVLYFWGVKSLAYLLAGSLLGGSMLHPMAGHLIQEHYMFEKGQETYSYYGPLNAISYNVGYHNEHHDFPQIPQTRLHKLREIAPEYYNNLYSHSSWCWVIWRFLTDPTMGPWTRMHRPEREGPEAANQQYLSSKCQYGTHMDASPAAASAAAAAAAAEKAPSTKGATTRAKGSHQRQPSENENIARN